MSPELKLKATLDVSDVSAKAAQMRGELNAAGNTMSGSGAGTNQAVENAAKIGGMIGGAIAGAMGFLVHDLGNVFRNFINDQRQVLREARTSNVSPDFVRGGTAAFGRAGVEDSVFSKVLSEVASSRADAATGEPKAIRAFKRLGLDPNDSVETIVRAMGHRVFTQTPGSEDAYALKQILGSTMKDAVSAFSNGAAHGFDNESSAMKFFAYRFFSPLDAARQMVSPTISLRNTPPLSTYEGEQAAKAESEQRKNDERDYKLRLSLMTPQSRMQALLGDEEGLSKMERWYKDPEFREQIRSKRMGVAQEIFSMMPEPGATSKISGDQYSRMGLFIGGSGDNLPDLSKQTVEQLRRVNEQLAQLPSQLGREL